MLLKPGFRKPDENLVLIEKMVKKIRKNFYEKLPSRKLYIFSDIYVLYPYDVIS